MNILLKKFGTTLTSRQLGREASAALQPRLADLSKGEKLIIDFEGVQTFSPSWGDEFLMPLVQKYTEKVSLTHTQNRSVQATLTFLENLNNVSFAIED